MRWPLVALVVALFCVAVTSEAQKAPYDGSSRQLAEYAAAYERARTSGYKIEPRDVEDVGYFRGFVDGVFFSHAWPCAPQSVYTDQVWTVVAKYLRENPDRWNIGAKDLVVEAVSRVWACKGDTGKTTKK